MIRSPSSLKTSRASIRRGAAPAAVREKNIFGLIRLIFMKQLVVD